MPRMPRRRSVQHHASDCAHIQSAEAEWKKRKGKTFYNNAVVSVVYHGGCGRRNPQTGSVITIRS